jgi:hypothetical protein
MVYSLIVRRDILLGDVDNSRHTHGARKNVLRGLLIPSVTPTLHLSLRPCRLDVAMPVIPWSSNFDQPKGVIVKPNFTAVDNVTNHCGFLSMAKAIC